MWMTIDVMGGSGVSVESRIFWLKFDFWLAFEVIAIPLQNIPPCFKLSNTWCKTFNVPFVSDAWICQCLFNTWIEEFSVLLFIYLAFYYSWVQRAAATTALHDGEQSVSFRSLWKLYRWKACSRSIDIAALSNILWYITVMLSLIYVSSLEHFLSRLFIWHLHHKLSHETDRVVSSAACCVLAFAIIIPCYHITISKRTWLVVFNSIMCCVPFDGWKPDEFGDLVPAEIKLEKLISKAWTNLLHSMLVKHSWIHESYTLLLANVKGHFRSAEFKEFKRFVELFGETH